MRPSASITRAIAEFVCACTSDDVPAEAFLAARRTIIDTMGITLAGSVEPEVRVVADYVGSQGGSPRATVIGLDTATTPALAALVNGMASDILGFSETSGAVQHHPSVPVLAAAWAVAEDQDRTGEEVALAHLLGVEVATALGYAVQPGLNIRGWHPVSVLGVFGAAVAAGRLMHLDVDQMANAIGLAGMNASGTKSGMGTMAKSFSRGRAAEGGVVAAELAARGVTGPTTFIEDRDGFLATFGDGASAAGLLERLGDPFEYVSPGMTLKSYPSCACGQPAIAGVLRCRQELGFGPDDVESIHCRVTPTVAHYLRFPAPRNMLEANYSMQFLVAVALLDGDVNLETFAEDRLRDARLRALMDRVQMSRWTELAERGFNPHDMPYATEVTVSLRDGRQMVSREEQVPWGPLTPPGPDELAAKYRGCAARVLDDAAIAGSLELLRGLERLDTVRDLLALVSQPTTPGQVRSR